MDIKSFVQEINKSVPSIDLIIEKFGKYDKAFSNNEANKKLNEIIIRYNAEHNYTETIDELIYSTDIGFVGIGNIVFRQSVLLIEERYKHFASYNDFYKICVEINSGSVFFVNESHNQFDYFSKDISRFLAFILEYAKAWRQMIYNIKDEPDRFKIERLIYEGVSKNGLMS